MERILMAIGRSCGSAQSHNSTLSMGAYAIRWYCLIGKCESGGMWPAVPVVSSALYMCYTLSGAHFLAESNALNHM